MGAKKNKKNRMWCHSFKQAIWIELGHTYKHTDTQCLKKTQPNEWQRRDKDVSYKHKLYPIYLNNIIARICDLYAEEGKKNATQVFLQNNGKKRIRLGWRQESKIYISGLKWSSGGKDKNDTQLYRRRKKN